MNIQLKVNSLRRAKKAKIKGIRKVKSLVYDNGGNSVLLGPYKQVHFVYSVADYIFVFI